MLNVYLEEKLMQARQRDLERALERPVARTTRRMVMDPTNEMMLWYLAYIDKLATQAGGAQPVVSPIAHRLPMRRQLARWCGHAALRVGTWLLAEELRTGVEHGDGSQQQTVASRA